MWLKRPSIPFILDSSTSRCSSLVTFQRFLRRTVSERKSSHDLGVTLNKGVFIHNPLIKILHRRGLSSPTMLGPLSFRFDNGLASVRWRKLFELQSHSVIASFTRAAFPQNQESTLNVPNLQSDLTILPPLDPVKCGKFFTAASINLAKCNLNVLSNLKSTSGEPE